MTWKLGLTGGIGSGKTAVSDHLASLGVPVIDTDVLAREVVVPGQPALEDIAAEFGTGVLLADGNLDREAMRRIVFNDDDARQRLEQITHPRIRERTRQIMTEIEYPYCVIVVPLFVESNYRELVDHVLVVVASRADRIAWVGKRNGLNAAEVEAIIDTQASDEERIAQADDVLRNDADLETLRARTTALHEKYLELAEGGG